VNGNSASSFGAAARACHGFAPNQDWPTLDAARCIFAEQKRGAHMAASIAQELKVKLSGALDAVLPGIARILCRWRKIHWA
jgi:hypothetical protein